MANAAELAAGTMMEASLPRHMRWIPKEMNIKYLKKAESTVIAATRLEETRFWFIKFSVLVEIKDHDEQLVCKAEIVMWVSEKSIEQS